MGAQRFRDVGQKKELPSPDLIQGSTLRGLVALLYARRV